MKHVDYSILETCPSIPAWCVHVVAILKLPIKQPLFRFMKVGTRHYGHWFNHLANIFAIFLLLFFIDHQKYLNDTRKLCFDQHKNYYLTTMEITNKVVKSWWFFVYFWWSLNYFWWWYGDDILDLYFRTIRNFL